MKPSQKPNQVTTSDSTSRTSQSRISREDSSAQTQRMTQPKNVFHSMLKSSSSTIQVKSPTDIAQSSIATPLTLLVNSLKSFQRTIEEQEKLLKRNPNSLNQVMLL
jgi:hypothetical protein